MSGREPRSWQRWTAEEDAFIAANYATMTAREIGERLGRSEIAVRHHARVELGLLTSRGRRRPKMIADADALARLDGTVVLSAQDIERARVAAGVPQKTLHVGAGYSFSGGNLALTNPSLRKAVDLLTYLGFDLVLRKRTR